MSPAQSEKAMPPTPGEAKTGWDQRPDPHDAAPQGSHPSLAFRQALAILTELREFLAYYVAVQLDGWKRAIRQAGILAGVGLVGGVAVMTVVIVAVTLLLTGIAGALAALMPRVPWLGNIITAVIFLAIPVLGILVGMRVLTRTFKSSMVNKYEERKRHQREQFGRDVRDEAAAARDASRKTH